MKLSYQTLLEETSKLSLGSCSLPVGGAGSGQLLCVGRRSPAQIRQTARAVRHLECAELAPASRVALGAAGASMLDDDDDDDDNDYGGLSLSA